jgi:hypothetical protein
MYCMRMRLRRMRRDSDEIQDRFRTDLTGIWDKVRIEETEIETLA